MLGFLVFMGLYHAVLSGIFKPFLRNDAPEQGCAFSRFYSFIVDTP